MNIYISIDGVLRNMIQKFEYHYVDNYLNTESDVPDDFEYNVYSPIRNDDLNVSFRFKSKDQQQEFMYLDFALEIFGHANTSYKNVFIELNDFLYKNRKHNIYVVGLDELGKSKPATLFFLSKNGFIGNNIKFILSENIEKEWKKVDLWITDNYDIIKKCPKNKKVIKFNTIYNEHFKNTIEINKLTEIKELWLKSLEKNTSSTLKKLVKHVSSMIRV